MRENYNFIANEKEMNNKVKAAGRGTAFPLTILTVALFHGDFMKLSRTDHETAESIT
jgi:hypothetical protein